MNYLNRAIQLAPEMVADRRRIHQNPEVGMELPLTVAHVCGQLTAMGLEPKLLGGGVTADIAGGKPGKTFLLRADMDALPMAEESGLPFAATGARAHTCGHDMHTAMLLGAARLLVENRETLQGTVRLMFQPGEETLQGAKAMIEAGILDGVDAAMGAHMMPMAPAGFLGWNYGAVSASSDIFDIVINGKGGHGASPHMTIDPINVGAHLHIALQELISREITPGEPAVITFGQFHAGNAANIIPETAVLSGTLRTYDKEVRAFLLERIRQVADHTAQSYRATAQFIHKESTCALVVDEKLAQVIGQSFVELVGPKAAVRVEQRQSGSEDFAEVADRVPSMFFVVGGGTPDEGHCYGGHHPKVTYNEKALPVGAAAYAQGATAWLAQNP